jgi:membrane glycosyltransferase
MAVGLIAAPMMVYLHFQIFIGNEGNYFRTPLWVLLFSIATILNTMVLTYDRYMAIVHPFRYLDSLMK